MKQPLILKRSGIFAFVLGLLLLAGGFNARAQATINFYVNPEATGVTGGPEYGTSWANAYRNIPAALDEISFLILGYENTHTPFTSYPIFVVNLAKGVYKPTDGLTNVTDRTASFVLQSNTHLIGGFDPVTGEQSQWTTVLSGDIGLPQANPVTVANASLYEPPALVAGDPGFADNSYNVLRVVNATGVLLSNLVVTCGNADATNYSELELESMTLPTNGLAGQPDYAATVLPIDSHVMGAGLFCTNSDLNPPAGQVDITIADCRFVNNVAVGYGGRRYSRRLASCLTPAIWTTTP